MAGQLSATARGVLALAVALAAAGCEPTGAATTSASPGCGFRIAYFGPLTGDNGNMGVPPRDGVKLAVSRYRDTEPRCPVALLEVDSQGDPEQAPELAEALARDPTVLGVVGPAFSGEAETAVPILDKAGITVITPSATRPSLAEQGWSVFHRAVGNDAAQGPAAGRYMRTVLRAEAVFVIDDATAYGKGLADEVDTQLGSLVVKRVTIRPGQTDFAAVVAQIRASDADAIFFGGYYAEAGPLLRQLRSAAITATFVAGDGVKDNGLLQGAGVKAAEGAVLTCPCLPPERAKGSFTRDFENAYGHPPGTFSAEAYDAANILLAGIDAGNHTRASLLAFVDAYDGDGVTTRLRFDDRGEIEPSSVVIWAYRVTDGVIVPERQISKDEPTH